MNGFIEQLRPSPLYWALVPVGAILAGVSGVPLGEMVALGAAVVVGVLVAVLLLVRAPEVKVGPEGLHAGRAFLDAGHLGDVEALGVAETRLALGPQLRADAYVVQRPWVTTAVRVGVDDAADPTPYWLVATRRPGELARAIEACRDAQRGEGQAAHSEHTG